MPVELAQEVDDKRNVDGDEVGATGAEGKHKGSVNSEDGAWDGGVEVGSDSMFLLLGVNVAGWHSCQHWQLE